jgi:hypothetical protein
VDVSFSTPALAALCNSERRLVQRWGRVRGRTIARRLLDVAAADAETLDRLPGATVSTDGSGETVIVFGGDIVVRGTIRTMGGDHARTDADEIIITSLEVEGRTPR